MNSLKSNFRRLFATFVVLFVSVFIAQQTLANAESQSDLGLVGGENFRDFGGYKTQDGKLVKTAMLFRSNQLNLLTAEDYQRVNQLGIRLVVDFRAASERADAPTLWQGKKIPHFLPLAMPPTGKLKPVQDEIGRLVETNGSIDELNKLAVALYRELPFEHAGKFSQLLEEVANSVNLPVLIHCAAGKDRTGLGAALILSVLDVPRDLIYMDYEMTNQFPLGQYADLPKTDANQLSLGVERAWLEGSFNAIEEKHGSVTNYLEKVLNIDAETRDRIKKNLLQ